VILSAPAIRNAPAIPLAALIPAQVPNSSKTISFKNVLDALETVGDENVSESGGEKTDPESTKAKKPSPDASSELQAGPQHSSLSISFPSPQFAQMPAEPASLLKEPDGTSDKSAASGDVSQEPHTAAAEDGTKPLGGENTTQTRVAAAPVSKTATDAAEVKKSAEPETAKSADIATSQGKSSVAGTRGLPLRQTTRSSYDSSTAPSSRPASSSVEPRLTEARASESVSETGKAISKQTVAVETTAPSTQTETARPTPMTRNSPSETVAAPKQVIRKDAVVQTSSPVHTPPTTAQDHTGAVPATHLSIKENSAPQVSQPAPAPTPIVEPANFAPPTMRAASPVEEEPEGRTTPATAPAKLTQGAKRSVQLSSGPAKPQNPPAPQPPVVKGSSDTPVQAETSEPASDPPASSKPAAAVTGAATPEAAVVTRDAHAETGFSAGATPKAPLTPSASNFAFEVRMLAPQAPASYLASYSLPAQVITPPVTTAEPQMTPIKPVAVSQTKPAATPQTQKAGQTGSQASADSTQETRASDPVQEKVATHEPKAPGANDAVESHATESNGTFTRWSEVTAPQSSEMSPPPSPELTEPAHSSQALAAQDTHAVTPDLPKTSASTGILLHLADGGQSAAAIRVTDRAGAVSVSVHAADPVLRESLKSNLGDLSSQLGQQGWKADVNPATAQAENQQDSHAGGQNSSQQQHSFGGDRQAPRDRRNPDRNWQQVFDQQISSEHAHPGGNR